jgi:hypothetical protein
MWLQRLDSNISTWFRCDFIAALKVESDSEIFEEGNKIKNKSRI